MSDVVGSAFSEEGEARPELPPADFDFLVYSLRLQAELNLGLLPFAEEKSVPDLDRAKHNIDLLGMLQEKTRGNLTPKEEAVLDTSVTELHARFEQIRKREGQTVDVHNGDDSREAGIGK